MVFVFTAACFFLLCHFQNGVNAFFFCIADKTAAVDNNDIRFRFIIRQFNSMTGKHTDHVLGIYQIFVTSE